MTTALKQYARLECPGEWFEDANAQPKDVVVSFGKSSLLLSDAKGVPLHHWDMRSLHCERHGHDRGDIFSMEGAPDWVRVEDPSMLDAIDTITKALHSPPTRSFKLRRVFIPVAVIGCICAAVVFGPGLMRSYADQTLGPAQRANIGQALGALMSSHFCSSPEGDAALRQLADRLDVTEIRVHQTAKAAFALPGGTFVIPSADLSKLDGPDVAAGMIAYAKAATKHASPLSQVLEDAPVGSLLKLITQNRFDDTLARKLSDTIPVKMPPAPAPIDLVQTFQDHNLAVQPFSKFLENADPNLARAITKAADNTPDSKNPSLPDGAWLGLQSICDF